MSFGGMSTQERSFRARFISHNGQAYAKHGSPEVLIESYLDRWGRDSWRAQELLYNYELAFKLATKLTKRLHEKKARENI